MRQTLPYIPDLYRICFRALARNYKFEHPALYVYDDIIPMLRQLGKGFVVAFAKQNSNKPLLYLYYTPIPIDKSHREIHR